MAAPLGFKTFNTGDVLTAADTNGYLMQGVWTFANATARSAAVTSPQEGNVSFLKDTNSLEIYDGSSWVAYGSGDITGVTAGTGISGGGTSGTVTITNDMATKIDAKGDLIVGTGADAYDRLAVGGTNGHVLTVDSSTSTGLKWAAAAGGGGGKVLQVVQATSTTATTISSTTYSDTGLSATITPSSASSKVLVLVAQKYFLYRTASPSDGFLQIIRDSTSVVDYGARTAHLYATPVAGDLQIGGLWSPVYLDSPSTTSAITYKTQSKLADTGSSHAITFQQNSATAVMILMEIGA